MKTAKRGFLVVAGVLSVLLAGCFNTITAIPPAAPGGAVPT
jgi:predicted small secreted protein